jgi:hypothetical protein
MSGFGLNSSDSGEGSVVGCCKHGNGPLRKENFLGSWRTVGHFLRTLINLDTYYVT